MQTSLGARTWDTLGFTAPPPHCRVQGTDFVRLFFSSPFLFIFWLPAQILWVFTLNRIEEVVRNNHFNVRGSGNYRQAQEDGADKMSRWKSGLTSEEGWPSVHTCACLRVRVCTYASLRVQLRLGTARAVHKEMQERRCPGAGGALLGVCRAESGGARVRRGKPAATVQAPKSQPPGALLALREIAPATYTRPLRGSGENP